MRALSWNLFHGRDHPPDPALLTRRSRLLRITERDETHTQVNRPLDREFATVLAGLDWELALLQEAPPRWLAMLGQASRASGALALTSRNTLAPLRAGLARLNPDLIASGEGGSNMVLVRAPARIVQVERLTLARRPERRRLLLVRVEAPDGRRLAVACTHLSETATGNGVAELEQAAETAVAWAGIHPLVFGGDLNLRPADHPQAFERLRERFGLTPPTGPRVLDHLMARGAEVVEVAEQLDADVREVEGPRGLLLRLSDHAPVAASFGVR